MAHPTGSEAAGSSAPTSVAEKAADFENFLFGDEETEEALLGEEEDEAEDDFDYEETDEADEQDDEDDEQAQPAIEPPVSLNAEEKEVFGQLPPEAQAAWAASETRRNQQVQEATTRAKDAQRQAEATAATANAQAEARFAEQLKAFTTAFEPQMPDPSRYADIQTYQRDKAIYDHAKAQHDSLMQQVAEIGVETPEMREARIRARDADLIKIPEIADEATRDTYVKAALDVATMLGYDVNEIGEHMNARDLKALAQTAQWKADSEELAKIKAKSTERRRDKTTGQFKSMKPGSAPQQQSRAAKADKSFQRVKATKGNRGAFGEASADWLEKSGYL